MTEKRYPESEEEILECIDKYFDNTNAKVSLGRGDDCAALKSGRNICISSDLFLEDIHFRKSYFTPDEIGYKALAVNISDLAGFGAIPIGFSLCLGLPEDIEMPWLENLFRGMSDLSKKYGLALIGGDLSQSDKLHLSITVFGENMDNCGFLSRDGARPNDTLFVVGPIGMARIGLCALEEMGRTALSIWPQTCMAHLAPMPQVDAGLMLARAGYNSRPPALMDLSDGLLRDLPRLLHRKCSHKYGACLQIPPDMLHPEIYDYTGLHSLDPLTEALIGGEDYALLGACAPDMVSALQIAIPGFRTIGYVTDSGRITCNGQDVGLCGFDHFAKDNI